MENLSRTEKGSQFVVLLATQPNHPEVQAFIREMRLCNDTEGMSDEDLVNWAIQELCEMSGGTEN